MSKRSSHDPSATTFHVQTGVHSASHRQMHRRRGFDELPGGNWYGTSKTDGRCLELVYRRWKSLSVRRVISGNPFCALLSRFESVARSSSNGEGEGGEQGVATPTKTTPPQLFNRATDKSACTAPFLPDPRPPRPPLFSSRKRASILSSVALRDSIPLLFPSPRCSPRQAIPVARFPDASWHCLSNAGQGFALSIGTEIQ